MRNYAISIFLPVYNFDPLRLKHNVTVIRDFAQATYLKSEIIIVDDTSNKETRAAITGALDLGDIRMLRYENGPSRRENLGASFTEARHDIVCFMDIDLATKLEQLPELTDAINAGYDIAIGSRNLGIRPKREGYRLLISKIYNTALRVLFGSPVSDHTCGFKAFRKTSITSIVREMGYDTTATRGWFWDAEMIIRSVRRRLRVAEIPVAWSADRESTFSFKREIKIISYMIPFWFRFRFSATTTKAVNLPSPHAN